jgi:hypothetical protein
MALATDLVMMSQPAYLMILDVTGVEGRTTNMTTTEAVIYAG